MEKFHRKQFENLSKKQEKEKEEFIDKAHEEALKNEQRLKELSKEEVEIKGAKLEKAQEIKRREASLEKAEKILGKNFLGPEAVKNVFGVEFKTIPHIQFTEEDLERAKELGQMLVLQVDKMKDGEPMTLENLKKDFSKAHDGKKMWYSQNWYDREDFFKEETPKVGWKLVSKEVIPGSTNKNYLEQTEIVISYLKEKVFKDRELPKEYQEAISEFESQKSGIVGLMNSNWKSAADTLEKLQITQLTRENPAEVMYRLILQDQENEEKLLPVKYSWTLGRDSAGEFVYGGLFDSGGVAVGGNSPGHRDGSIGVSFSRSV